MIPGKHVLAWLLLVLTIGIAYLPFASAQSTPDAIQNNEARPQTENAQQESAVKPPEQRATNAPPENAPVPINTERIDEAGQVIGKKIDAVTAGASVKFGRWINAKVFGEISWLKLIACMVLLLLVLIFERAVRQLISMRMRRASEKSESKWGDLLLEALSKPLALFIQVYGIYWALSPIWGYFATPGGQNVIHRTAGKAADLGGTIALFWFIYRFIHILDAQIRKWVSSSDNSINEMLVPLVSKTVRVFVIVVGGMMVIQNMTGIELGPLVASLGIGGLAFALAGKDSIANFLGSMTILLDKPFHAGERIVIDKHEGFVEGVGFRSTRLRTLGGSLVSIPNEKIINSTLENIGMRSYLRWQANLGLTCETPPEKVERAVEIVQEILDGHEGMRDDYPPRVFFNAFNDWNLNISITAWYFPPDYWKYQAWLQKNCLEIMRRFREEGIEMAYPTQAVYQVDVEKPAEVSRPKVRGL
ncbi:MAG: mechanosensitive ion channel family protein [Syntrophobacteraceae bacterium]